MDNASVRQLEPRSLWNHFADINAIPRGSKKEDKIIDFMRAFGQSLGLETQVDEAGNVLIKKPASPGYEDHPPVILQAHLDMVHQKNADTDFDFDTQGIQMYVDGDWVKAKGTTLGADNGIGVAAIMAILSDKDLQHPPIEALFTVDEETGMTGAAALAPGWLKGKILLNLDSEDERELTIGCAGGIDVTATAKYDTITVNANFHSYELFITGLTGGHSGMDIHLGRANANKCLNRILWELDRQIPMHIHQFDGGGLRNAIPREARAWIWIDDQHLPQAQQIIDELRTTLQGEYKTTDPNLQLHFQPHQHPSTAIAPPQQRAFLNAIYACPNGIYRLSPDVDDLVQTSNNLARVWMGNGTFRAENLTRSAVDSEKIDQANAIRACFQLAGAKVEYSGSYPGWAPDPNASINAIVSQVYEELYGHKPHVLACHAGLECGIIKKAYPEVEMISFGPNIRGAHSPDEKVQISSVQRFWKLLTEVLRRL